MTARASTSGFYRTRALQLLASPRVRGDEGGRPSARDRALLRYLEAPFDAERASVDDEFVETVQALLHVMHGDPFTPRDPIAGLRIMRRVQATPRCRVLEELEARALRF